MTECTGINVRCDNCGEEIPNSAFFYEGKWLCGSCYADALNKSMKSLKSIELDLTNCTYSDGSPITSDNTKYFFGFICQSCGKENSFSLEISGLSEDKHKVVYELTPGANITFECKFCNRKFTLFLKSDEKD